MARPATGALCNAEAGYVRRRLRYVKRQPSASSRRHPSEAQYVSSAVRFRAQYVPPGLTSDRGEASSLKASPRRLEADTTACLSKRKAKNSGKSMRSTCFLPLSCAFSRQFPTTVDLWTSLSIFSSVLARASLDAPARTRVYEKGWVCEVQRSTLTKKLRKRSQI